MHPYAINASRNLEMVEAEIVVVIIRFIKSLRKLKTIGLGLQLCIKKQREAATSQLIMNLMVKRRLPPTGDILP